MPKKISPAPSKTQDNLASSDIAIKAPAKTKKRAPARKAPTRKKTLSSSLVATISPVPERAKSRSIVSKEQGNLFQNSWMIVLFWIIVFIIMLLLGRGYALYPGSAGVIVPSGSSFTNSSQHLKVAHNVDLTQDILDVLGYVVPKISINTDTTLLQFVNIEDATMYRLRSPSFFADVKAGDIVFEFNDALVLYRPSTKTLVNKKSMP